MKAIITSASEVDINGSQSVGFVIVDNEDTVLVNSSLTGDVDEIESMVKAKLVEYKAKSLSEKRLKEGDEIEL